MGQTKKVSIEKPRIVTVAPLNLDDYSILSDTHSATFGKNAKGIAATGVVRAILHNCQEQYERMKPKQKALYVEKLKVLTAKTKTRCLNFIDNSLEKSTKEMLDKYVKASESDKSAVAGLFRLMAKKTLITYDKSK